MTGLLTFIAIFAAIIFLTNKSPDIQRLKRDKPYLNLILILIAAGFIFNLFGSLMMFLFSICMPLSCKLHSIIVKYLCMKWKFDFIFYSSDLFARIITHSQFKKQSCQQDWNYWNLKNTDGIFPWTFRCD